MFLISNGDCKDSRTRLNSNHTILLTFFSLVKFILGVLVVAVVYPHVFRL